MPTSTNCFCILGFVGLIASAGCTSTTALDQNASLSPAPASESGGAELPDSITVASISRDVAAEDTTSQGTVFSAVAYASPVSATDSLAALQKVVAGADEKARTTSEAQIAETAPVTTAKQPELIDAPAKVSGSQVAARSPELDALIARYAAHYEVPVSLVRRVVKRESTFNPEARNGPYWGLMQIRHDTAKGMGYTGSAKGLLNAETNLAYAVKYLRGAYLTASGNHDQAVKFYSRGYYYDAKKRGLLEETGLRPSRSRGKSEVAVAKSAEEKSGELDRGARVVAASLSGVAERSAITPTADRMAGTGGQVDPKEAE